jgi:hypothetical protein
MAQPPSGGGRVFSERRTDAGRVGGGSDRVRLRVPRGTARWRGLLQWGREAPRNRDWDASRPCRGLPLDDLTLSWGACVRAVPPRRRKIFRWHATGPFLTRTLIPILDAYLHPRYSRRAFRRYLGMKQRYGLGLTSGQWSVLLDYPDDHIASSMRRPDWLPPVRVIAARGPHPWKGCLVKARGCSTIYVCLESQAPSVR